MTVTALMARKPPRDLPEGHYAIRLAGGETTVFQRVNDPFSEDSDASRWIEVRDGDTIPWSTVERLAGEFDSDTDPWLYLEGIERTGEELQPQTKQREIGDSPAYKIVITGPNGEKYRVSGENQSTVFSEAIELLIQNFGLIEALEEEGGLPYVPGSSSAILNNKPKDPDGSDMQRPHAVAGNNYYVMTAAAKNLKQKYLQDLASKVHGVSVDFVQGWE